MNIAGKRGAWLNQYAVPSLEDFAQRQPQTDYLIIKAVQVLEPFALRMGEIGFPWLAEVYAYDSDPAAWGIALADWMKLPGCVGGVINLEYGEGDGVAHWDRDDGSRTNILISEIQARSTLPLYACLDTRGERPNDPYQRVCADRCAGVIPMVYPGAFQQTPEAAFTGAINQRLINHWGGKPIMPAIQTYDEVGAAMVGAQCRLAAMPPLDGYSAYTLGHATDAEWLSFVTGPEPAEQPKEPEPPLTGDDALRAITDAILVPLAHGRADVALQRMRFLYRLAHRTMPKDW